MAEETKILPLPNDILKEIAGALDPSTVHGAYTLQQLRLTSRAFGDFATVVLFKGFDTFHLGDDYEEVVSRIRTLASSELRHRVRNLSISRHAVIPRAVKKTARPYKSDVLSPIADGLIVGFLGQMRGLLNIMGPDFRFSGVKLGGDPDTQGDFQAVERISQLLSRDIFPLLHTHDAFSEVTYARGAFFGWELGSFPGLRNPLSRFSRSLRELDIHLSTDFLGYYSNLGSIVRDLMPALQRFTLRYPKGGHLRQLYPPGDAPAEHLEYLRLVGGNIHVDTRVLLGQTLAALPNLSELHLIDASITRGVTPRMWYEVFEFIPEMLPNLNAVFFEGLRYHHTDWYGEPPPHPDVRVPGEPHRRPISTPHSGDFDSLIALLDELKLRRKEKGLEKDEWMSGFGYEQACTGLMDANERYNGEQI